VFSYRGGAVPSSRGALVLGTHMASFVEQATLLVNDSRSPKRQIAA
jgi:hypothetical protein